MFQEPALSAQSDHIKYQDDRLILTCDGAVARPASVRVNVSLCQTQLVGIVLVETRES